MLEIIVETVADARAAQQGGATQLDLKCDLAEGGLTPAAGLLAAVRSRVQIQILMMIRPHARDKVYSPEDLDVMCRDIRLGRELGADGFLLGANTPGHTLDVAALQAFQQAAGELPLHAHMFWMETADQERTLEQLISLGFSSIRTTGGDSMASKAPGGLRRIRAQQTQAAGRIDLFLAGGVTAANVAGMVAATGVVHAHAGSGVRVPQNAYGAVQAGKVQALREALDSAAAALAG